MTKQINRLDAMKLFFDASRDLPDGGSVSLDRWMIDMSRADKQAFGDRLAQQLAKYAELEFVDHARVTVN